MSNKEITIINLECPGCGVLIRHANMNMSAVLDTKNLRCLSCRAVLKNPYYLSSFDRLFSRTKVDNTIKMLHLMAHESQQRAELEGLKKMELEEAEREKQREKEEKLEAYQRKLNKSYFVEEDGGEKPYSEEDIKDLMRQGELKLSSKIKYGYETEEYSPLFSFEEFNQDYKKFM